jgi:F0F1-type ATP synthase delta subunit
MTGKKELQTAKMMLKRSLTNGAVDPSKVNLVLKEIKSQKRAHITRILKTYRRLLSSAIAKEVVIVESAAKITNTKELERHIKERTGAKKITYKINPQIILGARITHGDWVFDSTLDAKLNQLILR